MKLEAFIKSLLKLGYVRKDVPVQIQHVGKYYSTQKPYVTVAPDGTEVIIITTQE